MCDHSSPRTPCQNADGEWPPPPVPCEPASLCSLLCCSSRTHMHVGTPKLRWVARFHVQSGLGWELTTRGVQGATYITHHRGDRGRSPKKAHRPKPEINPPVYPGWRM